MKTTNTPSENGATVKRHARRMGVALLLAIMLATMTLTSVSSTYAQSASRQPDAPTGGSATSAARTTAPRPHASPTKAPPTRLARHGNMPSTSSSGTTFQVFANPSDNGAFDVTPGTPPVFSQTFPIINFNPPASAQTCSNYTNVDVNSRPFTDVVPQPDGTCATIVVQGNGQQAGVDSLSQFEAVATASIVIPQAGDVTFSIYSDDGYILSMGPDSAGNQPQYVSGTLVNPPPVGPFTGYQVVGADNEPTYPVQNTDSVNFPAAGTYPLELDYTECCGGQLSLVFQYSIEPLAQGPAGTERLGGGNPSSLPITQCVCDPIDTYSGNFWHTFDDLDIPGRGLPLDFSHTYNASTAAQNGPLGYGWTDSYNWSLATDGSGNVTITQENGSTVTFAPDGSGGYTPPSRVLATLSLSGGVYSFTRQQSQNRYIFNSSGKLIKEIDHNGWATNLDYNGSGQLTTVTDPGGRALSLAYDGSGRITTVTDSGNRSVSFNYDGSGNLLSFTDVMGGVTSFTYDSNHFLLTMTDPRGGVVTNVYDSNGRVTSQQDAMGRVTTFSYTGPDSNGDSSTTITDPRSNVTVEQYQNALLVSETQASGTGQAATWSYSYDPVSLGVATVLDPLGHTYSKTWDAQGNVLTSTDPLNNITTYTYNSLNEVLTVTDPLGVTTTNTYDAAGNLLKTATPLAGTSQSRTITYAYGSVSHPGDLTAMTNPDGQKWHYGYDAYGDRTSTTDPLGAVTKASYNMLGERTSETDALGNTTTMTYDAFGDVTAVTDPLGHTTSYQYDADRNQTKVTDPDGNVTQNTYDLDYELTQVTRADGTMLSYAYDNDGNQTTQMDGLGHKTNYAYDPLNRLSALSDPLSRITSYTYDAAGNRLSQTAPGNLTTSYSYDAANELVGVSYSDSTPAVTYAYDSDGRRTSMSDGTGTTTYSYDSLGRLTSATDGAGNTISYGYDLAGNLTSLAYPGGNTVTRGYDAAGRMTSVGDWLGHTTRFSYDKAGDLTGITYPDHVVGVLAYNHGGQLVTENYSYAACASPCRVAWRPLVGFSYARDAAGFVTSATTTGIAAPKQTYTYTSLNQLASATPAGGTATSYAYDKADEPTQLGAATLTEDAAGEVTQTVAGATTTTFSYDARGNRTQMAVSGGASLSYTFDANNHLTSVAGLASGTATYAYNGDGLRMSKTVGASAAEDYVWDTAEGLPLLLVDGATAFVTGPGGMPLEQITGSGSSAQALSLLTDQLGSVRALADSAGTIVATYAYDAYGATTATTGTASTPLRFAGQYLDAETGMYYLRARYYDPTTAQFLSRDPLVPLTKQPYVYASDNPLNATDTSGMFSFSWRGLHDLASAVSDVASLAPVVGAVTGAVVGGVALGALGALACGPLCAGIGAAVGIIGFGAFGFAAGGVIGNAMTFTADAALLTSDVAILRGDGSGTCAAQRLADQNQFLEDISGTAVDAGTFGVDRIPGMRNVPVIKRLRHTIAGMGFLKAITDIF